MDSFAISSHVGVGPVRFGMTRQEVRRAFGAPYEPFSRTSGAEPADHFPTIPAFAYYSNEGRLEAVEFAPDASVTLGELDLAEKAVSAAMELLAEADPQLERDASGCISKGCGVGLWTEAGIEFQPQSIIVFARGYYD